MFLVIFELGVVSEFHVQHLGLCGEAVSLISLSSQWPTDKPLACLRLLKAAKDSAISVRQSYSAQI